jgi:5-methylcytosine-specific restriction protein A
MPAGLSAACGVMGCAEVRPCRVHNLAREHARENWEVRKWYRTARWRALRKRVIGEQPVCDDCQAEGRVEAAVEVDHTIPHRGSSRLFWSRQNLKGKCKSHHSQKTRSGR